MLLIGLSSVFVQAFLLKWLLGDVKQKTEAEEPCAVTDGDQGAVTSDTSRPTIRFMSEHSVLLLGLGFNVSHLLVYALATKRWMIFANMFLAGLTFLSFPATSGILSSALSPCDQGLGLGTLAAVKGLSNVLGPLLFGVVYGTLSKPPYSFPEAMFYIGAAIVSVSMAIAVLFLPAAIESQMLKLQTPVVVSSDSYAAVPERQEIGGMLKVSSSDLLTPVASGQHAPLLEHGTRRHQENYGIGNQV
jgi:MFS family permease